jgi:transmembrane sensor
MAKLRTPLREYLTDDVSEEQLHRLWQRVRQRRAPRGVRTVGLRVLWAPAVALAALALALVLWPAAPGPLQVNGAAVTTLGSPDAVSANLSDGSHIDLAAGARLEVLRNDGKAFVSVLRKGRGTFEVKPGGPRQWRIEAAGVTVEVVGTRFEVARSEEQVVVSVEHGVVVVRGDAVPDGVQRLGAGETVAIRTRTVLADGARSPESPSAAALATAPSEAAPSEAAAPEVAAHEATERAATGPRGVAPTALLAAPQPAPGGADRTGITASLEQADRARAEGRTADAVRTLRAALARHPLDPGRALAAFTLAKLLLEGGDAPGAERALGVCLEAHPNQALAEDALARLVEARARSGDAEAARRAADDYAARYPRGRHRAEVERWASGG